MMDSRKSSKKAIKPSKAGDKMVFRQHFDQYLNQGTLHGLRFIGDRQLTWFERIFFFVALVLALYLSGTFIINLWIQWTTSTIVIMNSDRVPITDLPFPAVTICNSNLARKSVADKMEDGSREREIVQSFCASEYNPLLVEETWESMYKVIENVSQSCDEMIIACHYGGNISNCARFFRPVLTDGGICCQFNAIPANALYNTEGISSGINFTRGDISNEWNPDDGYTSQKLLANEYAFPKPAIEAGRLLGLRVILNANTAEFFCSSALTTGFKVLVHQPHALPRINDFSHLIPLSYSTLITVDTLLLKADSSIRKLSLDVRKCYFQNENPLEFFRFYDGSICVSECFMRTVYTECNCTLFYMPPMYPNVTACYFEHEICLQELYNLDGGPLRENDQNCDCMPACSELEIHTTVSTTPMLENAYTSLYSTVSIEDMATLSVLLPSRFIRGYVRRELATFTEFISSTGGILGFFLGFSLISMAEIFYFIFIRPPCIATRAAKKTPSVKPTTQTANIGDLHGGSAE